jgi:putative ABC transport system ATP-binding protein
MRENMATDLYDCKVAGRDNTIMIQLREVELTLTSSAGPVKILKGIDLKIEKGETVGLVGPSGSGKSSLLSVIAGLEAPTAGDVKIAGRSIINLNEDGLALLRGQNIGIVFQSFHLIPTMTALENVAVALELSGQKNTRARAREELGMVGLSHRLEHYPGQLSGGEQQRVAIARAVCCGVPILLADEPTGNLDAENGEHVIDLLFSLQKDRSTTLLLVTHDARIAARCDRIISLKDGLIDPTDGKAR